MSVIIEFNFHWIDKRVELDREVEKYDLMWKVCNLSLLFPIK